ncbi:hypothetical protein Celal_0900 [Cellulophaga algicola DSM 14237]|uniref:Secreted protein n=1 Tax=Cellulophaga algicola (strain DSM 14237 / IC166 / ACAM 630) TaxID=688270 RepID=E6X3S4_CELAD|nr:hypothetical protein [Cellulophaga algicola]ADV48227.1 hypothetical protein Celal_0900 [Cellulophaga algicola DSM 14237]
MKKWLVTILSVTMAILLLASTISWRVEKHYCLGHLMDIALFTAAQDCGMNMVFQSDDSSEHLQDSNSCCDDETIITEGQDDLVVHDNDFDLAQQFFIIAYAYSYFNLFGNGLKVSPSFDHYPPPIIVKDIHVLDEVYLI